MITVSRRLLFQPERYEAIEITVGITDIPDDTSPDEISQWLDELAAPEIHRANEVASNAEKDDTTVYAWNTMINQTTEEGR